MIQLLALLLTVPPVPHSPADRYAAAKQLLHVAPLPPSLRTQLRERAVSSYAYRVIPTSKSADYERRRNVEQLINRRLVRDESFDVDFDGCMIDAVGWRFTLSMLTAIGPALETPGGKILWAETMIPTAETCFRETLPAFLQYTGFARAITWFATEGPSRTLPTYETARTSLDVFAADLVAYCGPSTQDALMRRNGKLGIIGIWASKRRNNAATSCLLHGATLAGYDLDVIQTDGSAAKVIIAS